MHCHIALTPLQIAYQKQKDSVFFGKLPAEIRIQIYEHLLLTPEPVAPFLPRATVIDRKTKDTSIEYEKSSKLDATIARTCRAAFYEAHPILYGQNTITFHCEEEISRFEKSGKRVSRYEKIGMTSHPFGPPLISGAEGRFSLIRKMLVICAYDRCPPEHGGFLSFLQILRPCWRGNLALEHLGLLFTGPISKLYAMDLANEIIKETKPNDDGFGGVLRNLKKITIVKRYGWGEFRFRGEHRDRADGELVEVLERQVNDSDTEEA